MPRRPERRARAVEAGVIDRKLRLADVERPDRHRRGSGARHQPAVGRVLGLLGQRGLAAAGEQELRTEQTDALGPLLARALRVVGRLDVRFEADLDAVGGDARETPVLVQRLPRTRRADALRCPNCCQSCRRRDRRRLRPVDPSTATQRSGGITALAFRSPTTAGMRIDRARIAVWYVQLPSSLTSAGDTMPVELRDQRRRQFVRDEHERALPRAGTGPTGSPAARRLPHSRADDVRRRRLCVRAGTDRRRGRRSDGDLLERLLQRRFRVDAGRSR